ncbi:hypothetical protein [Sphingomonas koreensis]
MADVLRPLSELTDDDLVRRWLAGDGDDDALADEMAARDINF